MSKEELKKIDNKKLPVLYKLLLKIPGANLLENASSGVFWAIVVPIFITLEFFLSMFLLLSFPFPTNVALAGIVPSVILVMFLRISLERFINWWNATIDSGLEWNVERKVQDYIDLIRKKKKQPEKTQ
jgi:hypothetical protein